MKTTLRIAAIFITALAVGCATAVLSAASPQDESRLGDAAFAQGDYKGALAHYSRADDAAGLDRLAHELLSRHDYDGFLQCRQQAGKKVLIPESFRDNSRGWNVRNDDYVNASISGGKLAIEKIRDDGHSYVWVEGGLDPEQDFTIEATITKISGQDDNGFSLAWGMKHADDNYQFGFSGDGHFRYYKVSGGDWISRIPWTESAAIRKGNAANTISVAKTGDTLSFTINGQVVGTKNFEGFLGSRVGFAVSPKARIQVSSFRVEQYPSARGPWEEIAVEAMKAGDFDTALKYYFAAGSSDDLRAAFVKCISSGGREIAKQALKDEGLSEKAVRIRIASFLVAAGMHAEAAAELRKAGWDIGATFVYPLAEETFTDNSRQWAAGADDTKATGIANGKYSIEVKSGSYSTWNFFDLSPDADYRIDARFKRLSGPDEATFALIWGFKGLSDTEDFAVNGSGSFFYGYTRNGAWNDLVPTTSSGALRMGRAENTLTVIRIGDTVSILLNGTAVGHGPSRELRGRNIGFALSQKMAVEVSELRVVEYAPQFAQDLARSDALASDPGSFAKLAADMHLDQGQTEKALREYGSLGQAGQEGAKLCSLRLGDAAAAGKQWDNALDFYLKAGESPGAMQGLIAAYQALGRNAEAEPVLARLGELYRRSGKPDEAMGCFIQLTKPALLNAAAAAYEKAGDSLSASDLYKRAGNSAKAAELDRKLSPAAASGPSAAGEASPGMPSAGAAAAWPEVVLCAQSKGTGVTLFQIYDPNAAGLFVSDPDEVITLDSASVEMNPAYFFDSGNFGIVLPEEGPNGHSATMYGQYAYHKDNDFWGPAFTRKGPGEKGFGSDGASVWLISGGSKELIAKVASQDVIDLDGQKKSISMVRLVKGANKKWITDTDGRIVELQMNGTLRQIGSVSWREVTTPTGEHLALLMTRSMAPGSKWAGRYNGKLYCEK